MSDEQTVAGVAGVASTEPSSADVPTVPAARRRRGAARVVAWIGLILIAGALVAAALVSERAWVVLAAVAGLGIAWLLRLAWRLVRRRPWLAVIALVGVCGGVGALGVVTFLAGGGETGAPPGSVSGVVTVRYHAEGQVEDDGVVLNEELVVDGDAVAGVARTLGEKDLILAGGPGSDQVSIDGWRPGPSVDGYVTFQRSRTVPSERESIVASTVSIPLDLGYLSVRTKGKHELVRLFPRDGSEVEIAASKGAVGTTYPAADAVTNGLRPGREEVATIGVDRDVDAVSVAVLAGPLRNPAGRTVYEAFVWGPLPWAVGVVFVLIASLLGDKLKDLLGRAAGRALRAGRRGAGGSAPAAPDAA
jgi:hypothetical protein